MRNIAGASMKSLCSKNQAKKKNEQKGILKNTKDMSMKSERKESVCLWCSKREIGPHI